MKNKKNWQLNFILKKSDVFFFEKFSDIYMNSPQFCTSIFPKNINQTQLMYEISVLAPSLNSLLILKKKLAGNGYSGEILEVPSKNWESKSLDKRQPFKIGSFFIYYNDEIYVKKTRKNLPILIKYTTAFGTGLHESTRGCLRAIEIISQSKIITKPLDIGTGSSILSIATCLATKTRKTYSIESDKESYLTASKNVERNKLNNNIEIENIDDLKASFVQINSPYDLIIANIVQETLVSLAASINNISSNNSDIILSGITSKNISKVLIAYRRTGFFLKNMIFFNDWVTLILNKKKQRVKKVYC